ncbi:MAG TPA: neutral zinc metallopeptidase [Vitreimonas sp.]|jgi:predicted metalloprotease|nr:neutral zinc metallopeptidase [Vitreimonas sp.]
MRVDNERPSDNFEDRGGGRAAAGGMSGAALFGIFRLLGLRGTIIAIVVLGAVYLFNPFGIRDAIFGAVTGSTGGGQVASGESTCASSPEATQACDFSRRILTSTEEVWHDQFAQNRLPNYGQGTVQYVDPKLVVYSGSVDTACGNATSDVGPFYCPGDQDLYVDPSFYQVMAQRLNAPGDFAQGYVIAHEVGHHVQKLIGAMDHPIAGESQNQTSVRTELQADCFAGVWGHVKQASLQIDDADLREALNAAHQIGDDTLSQGRGDPSQYTHGTSEQRMRWFKRGFDSGDARQCDTWGVRDYNQL